jgi:hypothetical protein
MVVVVRCGLLPAQARHQRCGGGCGEGRGVNVRGGEGRRRNCGGGLRVGWGVGWAVGWGGVSGGGNSGPIRATRPLLGGRGVRSE